MFATTTTLDALNRPALVTDAGGNVTVYLYDKAGALRNVTLNGTVFVNDIHYDAKGRRQSIWYGNNTKTSYTYDALTYRLRRLLTVNLSDNTKVQDLNYYYDPVGNITWVADGAQQTLFYANSIITPDRKYTYDALYRLITASGREQINNTAFPSSDNWDDSSYMVNLGGDATRAYTQNFTYDAVGNILSLKHSAGTGSYTRSYAYGTTSNRLNHTTIGTQSPVPEYDYVYDVRGNMTQMAHLSVLNWNATNELSSLTQGTTNAYYQYSGGQRIRKYADKGSGNIKEERIYLGSYEIYRRFDGSGSLTFERDTVHISDDTGRIAMRETFDSDIYHDVTTPDMTRYIYSDQLQSASVEIDDGGDLLTYEEYHPYGTTSYQMKDPGMAAAAKRYRYTGKERDEESGLYYHGARYYIPWLGRWTACDPINSEWYNLQKGNPGRNRGRHFLELSASPYEYCLDNPIKHIDPTGEQEVEIPPETETQPIKIERNGPPLNKPYERQGGKAPADQLDHTGYDSSHDYNGSGANAVAIHEIAEMFKGTPQNLRPFTSGDSAMIQQERARNGGALPPNISNAYAKVYATKPTPQLKPPEKLTTDISKLSSQEKSAVMSRVMSGKGTEQDRIYLGQMVLQSLSVLRSGGSVSILNGKGTLTVDIKKGMLSGSFKEGDQTVIFDAKIKITGNNIDFLKVGIYGEKGFGTTEAQGTVGFPAFKKLIGEIENLAKNAGFKSGSVEYERRRPDGSSLKDSKSRIIPLNLK